MGGGGGGALMSHVNSFKRTKSHMSVAYFSPSHMSNFWVKTPHILHNSGPLGPCGLYALFYPQIERSLKSLGLTELHWVYCVTGQFLFVCFYLLRLKTSINAVCGLLGALGFWVTSTTHLYLIEHPGDLY